MSKLALLLLLVGASTVVSAEEPTPSPSATALPEITVLGDQSKTNPLDFVPTVSELSGEKLERKKQSSLGETLSHEVGVSSSFFGPNASRPVIRGMDGERIRVLSNGTGVLDASAASQDHEVVVEPMSVERIEIVRGPSALLYGSSAVGGVVNVITHRIPEESIEGLHGDFDSRYSSVDDGGVGALGLDYGVGKWAFHFDGSSRSSSDYKIPGYARTSEKRAEEPLPPEDESRDKVLNSANRTYNGAFGTSYLFNDGFVGFSYNKYDSTYGTVAEKDVKIKMKQDRFDAAFGLKNLGFIESLKFKNSYSEYEHKELAGEETGTVFKNRGDEARLEMKHAKLGDFQGIFGLQMNVFDFEALGEEAFLPPTKNQNYAAFLFEEAQYGNWKPSFGLRFDSSQVKSEDVLDNPNFGVGETKNFSGGSVSLGTLYSFNETQAVALNLAYTERAPNYQELFANGPHMATGAFEVGDKNLGKERSTSAELSYRHKAQDTQGSFGVFVQDFDDYISLSPTGNTRTSPDGDPLTEYAYRAVNARFYGAELDLAHQLPHLIPSGIFEIGLKVDMVKAKNKGNDENLPRITPFRETLSASYKAAKYTADLEVQRSERQGDTAPNETATDAYTQVNLGVTAPVHWDVTTLTVYGRVNNLFDELARNHNSVLKDIAPLPGRNVIVGLQAAF